jgi:hypothetical protein
MQQALAEDRKSSKKVLGDAFGKLGIGCVYSGHKMSSLKSSDFICTENERINGNNYIPFHNRKQWGKR